MHGSGFIVENTKEKALEVAKKLFQSGEITSYDEIQQMIKGYNRKTKAPIYLYVIHCYK